MVFAFAGLSTITSFFGDGAGHVSQHWDTPWMPPRSPRLHPRAALSGPAALRPRPAAARGREHLQTAARARRESQFELRPLAARPAALPERYLRFMAKSELFWTPFKQFATAAGAFPVRRGEHDTAALETAAAALPRGPHRGHVPGGHAAEEGDAEEVRGPRRTPARRGSRSRLGFRSFRRGSSAPTASAGLAQLRVAYGPPIPLDDLAGREDAPQVATERLMAAIGELERSA